MRARTLGVIPARLASTRLPRKPLHPILGRPLLEWVWLRVSRIGALDRVVVATDHPEIAELCARLGAPCVLTDPEHPSGTDRVAEVVRHPEWAGFDVVVNLQGDEPLMAEAHVDRAVELVALHGWETGTCATPVLDLEAWHNPSVVKVARAESGRALYFSRSPIPFRREGEPSTGELAAPPFLRHLGLYSYTPAALERWVALPPSPLEELERLEQLRPLEAGIGMGVAVVDQAAPGVDTPADAERMATYLQEFQTPITQSGSRR